MIWYVCISGLSICDDGWCKVLEGVIMVEEVLCVIWEE